TRCSDCAGVCLTACLLLTAELSYPKPSISLSPRGEVVLGGTVIIRCECRCQNSTTRDPSGNEAEFPITSVGWGDGGSYTCQYHTTSQTPDWSEPSDPMQLVVAGEGPSSASPLPAPQPAGHSAELGPIGTLRARLCPKSWAQQRGSPSGSRDGVSGGFPATGDLGTREGGIEAPKGPSGVTYPACASISPCTIVG
uniref:Ig-like domain-containing protein n=1 Tax=Gopherus agassizii TaxID=38772 RepID=A0A452GGC2_9SAUR